MADQPFGGDPLASTDVRTHGHPTTVTLATSPHGVLVASGCSNDGYAGNTSLTDQVTSSADDPGLPYLELLHCLKM
jgi:hypothetical protein